MDTTELIDMINNGGVNISITPLTFPEVGKFPRALEPLEKEVPKFEADMVFKAVVDEYHISKDELLSATRRRDVCDARTICIFLFRHWLNLSYEKSARLVNRDHATAIHSLANFSDFITTDKFFRYHYDNIASKVKYYYSLKQS